MIGEGMEDPGLTSRLMSLSQEWVPDLKKD
jgi:hypothetical protein